MTMHARGITGAALLALALSACSHSGAPSSPTDHAQLVARLVSKANAPSQVRVLDLGGLDAGGPGAPPTEPLDCSGPISVNRLFNLDPDAVPVDQANIALQWTTPGQPAALNSEFMYRYAADGAARALADLHTLVGRCPTYQDGAGADAQTHAFTIGAGPSMGDQSLVLRDSITIGDQGPAQVEHDAVVVRAGNVLIAVEESSRRVSAPSHLDDLMDAAWKAYIG